MPERVFASIAIGGTEGAPDAIQYFPAGESQISATVNGKPGKRTVRVEKGVEERFQRTLEKLLSGNVRPYLNFDHSKTGPAAGYPQRFFWQEPEGNKGGLMLEVDWTRAGKEAVEGRNYGYVSGEFLLGKDGVPVGLDTNQRPIGALVNDPAFENNARIAASKAVDPNQETEDMSEPQDLTPLIEAGALDADEAKRGDAVKVAAQRFKEAKKTTELDSIKAAKAEVDKEVETLKAKLAERDEQDAKAFVKDAVNAGKIKAKDEDAKAEWAKVYAANPAGAKKLLEAVPSIVDGLKPAQRGDKAPDHRGAAPGADKVAAAKAKANEEKTSIISVFQGEFADPDAYENYRNSLG